MQPNTVLEKALKSAFDNMGTDGKAKLLALEGQPCEVVVKYNGLDITIAFDERTEVHFHNLNSDSRGENKAGGAKRDQHYYLISFGLGGSLSVDGRGQRVYVRYQPPTKKVSH